jgi:hypothetical protein
MIQNKYLQLSVGDSRLDRLEGRLSRIVANQDDPAPDLLVSDFDYLVTELFRMTGTAIDIASINRRLAQSLNIDFRALDKAVELLAGKRLKSSQHAKYPRDTGRLPKEFFHFGTPELARPKIARYLCLYRPQITNDACKSGQCVFPTELFGLGRVLAWSEGETEEISGDDEALTRTLSRIVACYGQVVKKNAEPLAQLLRVTPEGRLFVGPDFSTAKREAARSDKAATQLLVFELGNLLLTLRSSAEEAEPVVRTLRRYKLGLEFTAPDCRPGLIDQNEKFLQRSLRKYLVDHGVYSFGTDFGKAQADAFIDEYPDSYVLEVKLFTEKHQASERAIRQSLVQLQNYMDLVAGPRRGILVLYCFGGPIIVESRQWLHGRYWLLPVNLHKNAPSKRTVSLSISESSDPRDLISVQRV